MTSAKEAFARVHLRDTRLNSRLAKLAELLGAKLTAIIPAVCGAWGKKAAAYLMVDRERCA